MKASCDMSVRANCEAVCHDNPSAYHVAKVNVNFKASITTCESGSGVDRASGGETCVVTKVGPFVGKTAPVGAGKVDRETDSGSDHDTPRPNAELAFEPEATNESVVVKGKAVNAVPCTNFNAGVYIYVNTIIGPVENKPGTSTYDTDKATDAVPESKYAKPTGSYPYTGL